MKEKCLEQLVLRSGNKALQQIEYVFRQQVQENDLLVFSGRKKLAIEREYRVYEQNVSRLLLCHWRGSARGLKRYIRQLLKPFCTSMGMLRKLLSTPIRIIASGCLMVLLSGHSGDAAMEQYNPDRLRIQAGSGLEKQAQSREIFFIDPTLPDIETLVGGIPAGAPVVILKPTAGLIEQLLDHLLDIGPVTSLHLLTHGAPGQLLFGATVIDQDTLQRQAQRLEILGSLLTGPADIHLYGCRIAAGEKGDGFVRLFSALTNADVAASNDFTGPAARGGDWDLELVVGKVNTRSIASVNYSALLASGRVIAGDGSGGGGGGATNANGSGGAGGDGGEANDTLAGTAGDDVLFGDGSGGGGGGNIAGGYSAGGLGGKGGSGSDTISGGAGDDILFGDGFDGEDGSVAGGIGGFGGGGGGGGAGGEYSPGGSGGIGGIGGGGGGGGDHADGGDGGYGGGGGGGGSYGSSGSGGGFNAAGGSIPDANDGGGGGGGGGYAGGLFGTGGSYLGAGAGNGGVGGSGEYDAGGGNGGNGYANSYTGKQDGAGGGGGGFGGGTGGVGGNSSGYYAPSAGANGGTSQATIIDNPGQDIYTFVKGKLGTLAGYPGGSGDDILDGGPGSDHLFGMGGSNTFVFASDDAFTGSDVDTIYDWNTGSANKIKLTTNGNTLDKAAISTIIATQQTNGNDRTLVHANGTDKVTLVVKDIARDLTLSDFVIGGSFPWTMFLPAIISSE